MKLKKKVVMNGDGHPSILLCINKPPICFDSYSSKNPVIFNKLCVKQAYYIPIHPPLLILSEECQENNNDLPQTLIVEIVRKALTAHQFLFFFRLGN